MKRGFTLIELLGVIVILGIVALIIVPSVDTVIKKSKQTAYDNTKTTIIDGAKNWLTDNKSLIDDGQTVDLTLSDLKSFGYIDLDIKNPATGKCLDNTMQIAITRDDKKYTYSIVDNDLIDGEDTNCGEVEKTPSIYLVGANPLNIEINTPFVDPGAKATSDDGDDISNNIITTGTIDTSVVASNLSYKYTIIANGISKTVTRKINIVDTTNPVITGKVAKIELTTAVTSINPMDYVTITDNSGSISDTTIKSNVSIGIAGNYTITYIVTDKSGNATTFSIPVEIKNPLLADTIRSQNTIVSTAPTLTNTSYLAGDTSGLYSTSVTSSGLPTYYFRGNVTNNYVKFNNYIWKIIRINEDGTIRIIRTTNLSQTYVINSNIVIASATAADMYYANSTLKPILESWYSANFASVDRYVSSENYCDGLRVSTPTTGTVYYGGTPYTSYTPTFVCSQNVNSKIGLLTIDEAVFAGLYYNKDTTNNYLTYQASTHALIGSPDMIYYLCPGSCSKLAVWWTFENGNIQSTYVAKQVYPVINLSSNVTIKAGGTGTSSNPYVINGIR